MVKPHTEASEDCLLDYGKFFCFFARAKIQHLRTWTDLELLAQQEEIEDIIDTGQWSRVYRLKPR